MSLEMSLWSKIEVKRRDFSKELNLYYKEQVMPKLKLKTKGPSSSKESEFSRE